MMLSAIAAKFRRVWSNQNSEITVDNCGHAPFKRLQDARKILEMFLERPADTIEPDVEAMDSLVFQSDILVDYAREMLHAYPYREVPPCWRELYTDAGILKALALGLGSHSKGTSSLKQAILTCDSVLIMAGAAGAERKMLLYELIDALESKIEGQQEFSPSLQKRVKINRSFKLGEETEQRGPTPTIRYPIPRMALPTMDAFQQHVKQPLGGMPIVITGAIDHWPARERWTDLDTICRTAGPDRLVPIEIGSQYTDEQWTQKMVTIREFIEQFILCDASRESSRGHASPDQVLQEDQSQDREVGYLAQHDLFDQIPRLRRDIDIPDYCMVEPLEQDGYCPPDDVLLNAWFGPEGTVSPMHTDPYYNLLAQVVGKKYVRLYAPNETSKLYCFGSEDAQGLAANEEPDQDHGQATSTSLLGNTSQVDVEHPDLTRHPLFAEAKYVETVLGPGEVLYIPFRWWHYVRSLSTSFSVSFWF